MSESIDTGPIILWAQARQLRPGWELPTGDEWFRITGVKVGRELVRITIDVDGEFVTLPGIDRVMAVKHRRPGPENAS